MLLALVSAVLTYLVEDRAHLRIPYRTDINKILRNGDYADPDMAVLNGEAIEMWERPEWKGTFRQSGVAMLTERGSLASGYAESSYQNASRTLSFFFSGSIFPLMTD